MCVCVTLLSGREVPEHACAAELVAWWRGFGGWR